MILKLFTIFDNVAKVYLQPFCAINKGSAIRSFAESINNPSSDMGKYPADFILFELGEYDDNAALFVTGAPLKVAVGSELLTKSV